jgi:N6-adenosine-specific RNA methylase IME4
MSEFLATSSSAPGIEKATEVSKDCGSAGRNSVAAGGPSSSTSCWPQEMPTGRVLTGRASKSLQLALAKIRVGERTRRDLGDVASLAESVEQLGLLHPIVVTPDGELIAGERRLEAFRLLGRSEIPAHVLDLENIVSGQQAENIDRKDFTPEERVSIGEKIEMLLGNRRGERTDLDGQPPQNFVEVKGQETRSIAARKAGFKNPETYRQAKVVRDAARDEPERFGKALDDMNRTGRVHGPFKRVKIAKQSAEIRREPPPLPGGGPYRVIVVDPPWPYDKRDEDPSHRAVHPYPTMSIAQIASLRVADVAHENCILWLWTTNFHMQEAFGIAETWGFQHKTILTWFKDKFGFGAWLRCQTEHAIFATCGRPTVQLTNESTALFAQVRAHSEKPDEFYALVERLCPAPRYCELFSRRGRPNWDGHGDEYRPASALK